MYFYSLLVRQSRVSPCRDLLAYSDGCKPTIQPLCITSLYTPLLPPPLYPLRFLIIVFTSDGSPTSLSLYPFRSPSSENISPIAPVTPVHPPAYAMGQNQFKGPRISLTPPPSPPLPQPSLSKCPTQIPQLCYHSKNKKRYHFRPLSLTPPLTLQLSLSLSLSLSISFYLSLSLPLSLIIHT